MRHWLWNGKPWEAFKNLAILFSFGMNILLLIAVLLVLPLILPAVRQVVAPAAGGLERNFVTLGQARLVRTIEVVDDIPIQFDLPVVAQTRAQIVEPVPMALPTNFVLPGGGGTINGTVFFELPAGVDLPVSLDIVVPVSQTVPVAMAVDVDIPLHETELGPPLDNLQGYFSPLRRFLLDLPADNGELYERLLDQPPAVDRDGSAAASPQ